MAVIIIIIIFYYYHLHRLHRHLLLHNYGIINTPQYVSSVSNSWSVLRTSLNSEVRQCLHLGELACQ